jgi:hypothetical protein
MSPCPRLTAGLVAVVALALGLAFAAPASARTVELGQLEQEAQPSCPANPCLAIARTTGYQAKVGTQRDVFVVPEDGKIVAWSITLATPSETQVAFFDERLGGAASARITILRPGDRLSARVTGQSLVQRLTPFFGQRVQFPLGRALNVRKGYIVALTVPTWAPALAVGFGNDTSWRASRPPERCRDTEEQTAQTELAALTRFRCLNRTARIAYTATLVTTPVPTAEQPPPEPTPEPTPTPTPGPTR